MDTITAVTYTIKRQTVPSSTIDPLGIIRQVGSRQHAYKYAYTLQCSVTWSDLTRTWGEEGTLEASMDNISSEAMRRVLGQAKVAKLLQVEQEFDLPLPYEAMTMEELHMHHNRMAIQNSQAMLPIIQPLFIPKYNTKISGV